MIVDVLLELVCMFSDFSDPKIIDGVLEHIVWSVVA